MERVRVEHLGANGDLVELARADPHPALSRDVLGYTGYRERTAVPLRRRELPFAGVVVILSRGPELRVGDPDAGAPGTVYTSFVAGLDDRAVLTEHEGVSDGLQLNLTPFGAYRLFGVPMWELARRALPLDEVLGREGVELAERLDGATGWEQRFALLEAWLARRLDGGPRPSPHLEWAWRRIVESEGRVVVERLASELGCSRRHLAAGFREQVGLPPKAVARVLRFRRALRLVEADDAPSLGQIAADCGYYDQAHLNREFRRLAGSTPTELGARRGASHSSKTAPCHAP